jgi:hypothetical protein
MVPGDLKMIIAGDDKRRRKRPALVPGRRLGADKSKETRKGIPTQLQALKSIASNALRFGIRFFKKE